MNGFIINIEKNGAPLELYAEPLSALQDADGYIQYERYRPHQFQAPAEVGTYYEDIHYVHVPAFSHDPWLSAEEVKSIGEEIGERTWIGNLK